MLSLAFVRDAEDLVFYGQTGRGKTHMATALGIAATSAGRPARFRRTAQLVLQLGKAKGEGALDRLLADVAKARLLVLDEFGCVPFDVGGARLLDRVVSDSYEEERLGGKAFGSTKSGIAPFYSDKYAKIGIQVCDLFHEDRLRERLTAAVSLKNVLFEHLYHKPSLDVEELYQQLMELRVEDLNETETA